MQFESPQNGIECAINDLNSYNTYLPRPSYTFGKLFTYKFIDHYESDIEFNVYNNCILLKNIYSDNDIKLYNKNIQIKKIIINMLNGTFTINDDQTICNI